MKQALLVFICFLILGLFVGGPDYFDSPITRELSESGHFVLFFFSSFYLSKYSRLSRIKKTKRAMILLSGSFVLGLLVEVIQSLIGRSFEMKDLLNDLLGTLAGLLFYHLRFRSNLIRSALLVSALIFLVIFSQRPLILTIVKEFKLWQEFPVLADFETVFQLERWTHHTATVTLSESKVKDGRFSMRVDLSPGKYPGIALKRLYKNWQDYQFLQFSIYLDAEHPIDFLIKIYDRQHPDSGYDINDRFNQKLRLSPGWNDFSLPLRSIENAPTGRQMDMKNIVSLTLFTVKLEQKITFYLDRVRLTNNLL